MKEPESVERPAARPLVDTEQAAVYLGLAKHTLENLRYAGKGPAFVRLGARAVRYRVADLDAYAAANLVTGGA